VGTIFTVASVTVPIGVIRSTRPVDEARTGVRYLVVGTHGDAAGLEFFKRDALGAWSPALSTARAEPATSDVFSPAGDFTVVQTEAFAAVHDRVLGFRNGLVAWEAPVDDSGQTSTKPSTASPLLVGPGAAVGYPRHAGALEHADQLTCIASSTTGSRVRSAPPSP
jgi:hypothetical protein